MTIFARRFARPRLTADYWPLAAVVLSIVFTATTPGPASAAPDGQTATSRQQIRLGKADLNLLRGPTIKTNKTNRRARRIGSGSYVCSAAGFGQRSRCLSN